RDPGPADGPAGGPVWRQPREIAHLGAAARANRLTPEADLARHDAPRAIDDAEDRAGGHTLAATALAHHTEGGGGGEVEAYPVPRPHRALGLVEVGLEPAHGEEGGGARPRPRRQRP